MNILVITRKIVIIIIIKFIDNIIIIIIIINISIDAIREILSHCISLCLSSTINLSHEPPLHMAFNKKDMTPPLQVKINCWSR
jgi:hypothetical protein